jgi:prevent-host-death family protein
MRAARSGKPHPLCAGGGPWPVDMLHDLGDSGEMAQINIREAKAHLSRLLRRVESGEEIVIARAGKPVARLVAVAEPKRPRELGRERGKIWIAEDFDAPLPDDLLAAFEGGD